MLNVYIGYSCVSVNLVCRIADVFDIIQQEAILALQDADLIHTSENE